MVAALGTIAILAILIGGMIFSAVEHRKLNERYQLYQQELAIAEFHLNKAFAEISYALKKTGATNPSAVINQISPASVPNYQVVSFNRQLVSDTSGVVPTGEKWAGYNLRRLKYRVSVRVKRTDAFGARYTHPGVSLQQEMNIAYVPLYVYGIFSHVDLEMHPGQIFTETGRVHCNSTMYYGSDGSTMDYTNYVTAAGHFQYGRHPDSPQYISNPSGRGLRQGTNRFWDGTSLVNANQDGINVDWMYNRNGVDWVTKSQDLWHGFVRDADMGVAPMLMPWPEVIPTTELIQPPNAGDFGPLLTQKLCYKAGLLITRQNGVNTAVRSDGSAVSLTYTLGSETKNVVSVSSIYNEREGGMVNLLNVDLANMQEAGICPPNGIVYVRNMDTGGAVRVVNGSDVPGNQDIGFTLATPNPLYVKGNYNTTNETVSMLAGDSINILSPDWSDSANNTASERNASSSGPNASGAVVTNAVVLGGNVPTGLDGGGTAHYSGGIENFFRYMENWGSTRSHTFKGSIILLYNSLVATGYWDDQNYAPPARVWSWNPTLAQVGPPGSPMSFDTYRTNWQISN